MSTVVPAMGHTWIARKGEQMLWWTVVALNGVRRNKRFSFKYEETKWKKYRTAWPWWYVKNQKMRIPQT